MRRFRSIGARVKRSGIVPPCLAILAVLVWLVLPGGIAMAQEEDQFTTDFRFKDCNGFEAKGKNPYFVLNPGHRLVLEEQDDEGLLRIVITVLNQTERIRVPGLGWVNTRVVEERESLAGRLIEVSRNFFAICERTNDVAYFGEDVDIFLPNGTVDHSGQWRAGRPDGNGVAEPGVIMPGTFLLGSRYFQEIADGIALDRAENVAMGLVVHTEAGTLRGCVKVIETTPLEPGSESEKVYCPGVGLVMDNDAFLVEFTRGHHDDDDDDNDD